MHIQYLYSYMHKYISSVHILYFFLHVPNFKTDRKIIHLHNVSLHQGKINLFLKEVFQQERQVIFIRIMRNLI